MIITIDGPSGTGKSTVAKMLAGSLNFNYCNTGAMYRTLAYARLDPHWGSLPIQEFLENPPFYFSFVPGEPLQSYLGEHVLNKELATQEVANLASQLSQLPEVRAFMHEQQKKYSTLGNCVFEGRDMGSKVFPDADLKIFLTAKPEIRAQRRLRDLPENTLSKEELTQELLLRDQADSSRTHDPLIIPEGAIVIDSSDLTISQVLEKILSFVTLK
ncbi:cytidylate kinase [Chlamydia ibidis]|uniref:Cytidylate kinase n=2 Tax=Chlamydia ibidis TaxID=1405396 RepID=S7KLM2_9CHLA|nr:(d)CMP kinase [Chlamydia ibidis]EPP35330.1 cytidylate kinase [Chlamydia ibidis]EQM63007.1 cytidylate kinase [Chlamydia ibidis 10-1398/6]